MSGYLTAIVEEGMSSGRRRRCREEFTTTVEAAGQGTGGSVATVELDVRLDVDLLRRWIDLAGERPALEGAAGPSRRLATGSDLPREDGDA
jgi:hypothetical protein